MLPHSLNWCCLASIYLYTGFAFPALSFFQPCYNLSAILPRASASLLRTPIKLSVWSFLWSLSSWQLIFMASNWVFIILLFCSTISISWPCRLVTPPSGETRFRFFPSRDVEPFSGFKAGCCSFGVPMRVNPISKNVYSLNAFICSWPIVILQILIIENLTLCIDTQKSEKKFFCL